LPDFPSSFRSVPSSVLTIDVGLYVRFVQTLRLTCLHNNILGVIGARLAGDAEVGTEEGCAKLRDKLLHRVGFVAEALAELAIATRLVAREMAQFVKQGGVVGLGGVLVAVPMKASRGGK
jgi:hypothetical protein